MASCHLKSTRLSALCPSERLTKVVEYYPRNMDLDFLSILLVESTAAEAAVRRNPVLGSRETRFRDYFVVGLRSTLYRLTKFVYLAQLPTGLTAPELNSARQLTTRSRWKRSHLPVFPILVCSQVRLLSRDGLILDR